MRYDADWMTRADERILEYLEMNGPSTPKKMSETETVRFTRQHINQRCKKLVEYGMLVHLGNGVYDITDTGEQYLAGELNAQELTNNS